MCLDLPSSCTSLGDHVSMVYDRQLLHAILQGEVDNEWLTKPTDAVHVQELHAVAYCGPFILNIANKPCYDCHHGALFASVGQA